MQEADSKQSEQTFFDDPALDALVGVVMALAMEHYVLRDRVRSLEEQLARAGHVDAVALASAPAGPAREGDQRDAAAFVQDLLFPILGIQQASGLAGKFSLKRKA